GIQMNNDNDTSDPMLHVVYGNDDRHVDNVINRISSDQPTTTTDTDDDNNNDTITTTSLRVLHVLQNEVKTLQQQYNDMYQTNNNISSRITHIQHHIYKQQSSHKAWLHVQQLQNKQYKKQLYNMNVQYQKMLVS